MSVFRPSHGVCKLYRPPWAFSKGRYLANPLATMKKLKPKKNGGVVPHHTITPGFSAAQKLSAGPSPATPSSVGPSPPPPSPPVAKQWTFRAEKVDRCADDVLCQKQMHAHVAPEEAKAGPKKKPLDGAAKRLAERTPVPLLLYLGCRKPASECGEHYHPPKKEKDAKLYHDPIDPVLIAAQWKQRDEHEMQSLHHIALHPDRESGREKDEGAAASSSLTVKFDCNAQHTFFDAASDDDDFAMPIRPTAVATSFPTDVSGGSAKVGEVRKDDDEKAYIVWEDPADGAVIAANVEDGSNVVPAKQADEPLPAKDQVDVQVAAAVGDPDPAVASPALVKSPVCDECLYRVGPGNGPCDHLELSVKDGIAAAPAQAHGKTEAKEEEKKVASREDGVLPDGAGCRDSVGALGGRVTVTLFYGNFGTPKTPPAGIFTRVNNWLYDNIVAPRTPVLECVHRVNVKMLDSHRLLWLKLTARTATERRILFGEVSLMMEVENFESTTLGSFFSHHREAEIHGPIAKSVLAAPEITGRLMVGTDGKIHQSVYTLVLRLTSTAFNTAKLSEDLELLTNTQQYCNNVINMIACYQTMSMAPSSRPDFFYTDSTPTAPPQLE